MSDLVKRLRKEEDSLYGTHPCGLLHDAADRIEILEAVIREIISQIDQGGESGKVFARDYCIQNARKKLAGE